jgi:FixJ family two-component response regulator
MNPVTNSGQGKVIAVIDDEVQIRKALGRLLGSFGYETETFEDGAIFLEAQSRRAYACILLDLHLPGISGWVVLERLTGQRRHPPILVVTAEDRVGTRSRVMAMGASAYLIKPVDEVPLITELERSLGSADGASSEPH